MRNPGSALHSPHADGGCYDQHRRQLPLRPGLQPCRHRDQPSGSLVLHRRCLRCSWSGRLKDRPNLDVRTELKGKFAITRPYAIVTSALAATIISLLAASIIISALAPEASNIKHPNLYNPSQGHLYRLSHSRWHRLGSFLRSPHGPRFHR